MRISVISGHITATEKKHIKALFAHNMTEGKVNTKNYFITKENAVYTAKIIENEFSDYEQKVVQRQRKVQFKAK